LEHTIVDLEKDLRDAFDSAEITERDARYVIFICWSFILHRYSNSSCSLTAVSSTELKPQIQFYLVENGR